MERTLSPKQIIRLSALKNYWTGEPEIRILRTLVTPGKCAIDIGANRGVYTYFLSRLCAHVFAYEPNPMCVGLLVRTFGPNVTVRQTALSDEHGTAVLHIPLFQGNSWDGWGSLAKNFPGADSVREVVVDTRCLDEEGITNVGFIKIDVEGHERAVLAGAREVIRQNRPNLLIEIEERHCADGIDKVFRFVEDMGYRGAFLRRGQLVGLEEFDVRMNQGTPEEAGHAGYINNFVFRPL
jgi:FkbM family methyltransferase